MKEQRSGFPGTYFDKDIVLRLASIAKIFSWVVVGIFAAQWFVQLVSVILAIARGYWMGMGYTDYAMNLISLFEQPLRGVVYFIVLQAVAQAMLMFMDIEDNTRRAAREATQLDGGAHV
jgi:uncharacterized membrane protein